MTTRLDQIRQRLEAATPGPWGENGVEVAGAPPHVMIPRADKRGTWTVTVPTWGDSDLIAHAPQDLRDLLETLDRIIDITKRWHDSYELKQDPDPDRPSHAILRNIYRIAVNLESNRRLNTYDWTRERVDGTPLP